jgi:type I restriction enzyme S subunit
VARIRLRPTEVPAFFRYQLLSEGAKRRLGEITVGTTRKEISIGPLRTFLVARPQPHEQEAIAAIIGSVEADHSGLFRECEKLRLLKTGLMQDLLTGCVPVAALVQSASK